MKISNIKGEWHKFLEAELCQSYMQNLKFHIETSIADGKEIYPPREDIFNAFALAQFEDIKCVIVGQDPYHQQGQAHGLAFSVKDGVPPPRSLKNIYKELRRDLALNIPQSGNLESWAKQGVLLLNAVLTVDANIADSHKNMGWEQLTQKAIVEINDKKEHVVFLAWGRKAHKICENIDTTKHRVIKTSHPSPLGANKSSTDFKAFLGSGCFSEANEWLYEKGIDPINWSIE